MIRREGDKAVRVQAVFFALATFVFLTSNASAEDRVSESSVKAWKVFRANQPFQNQVIAVSNSNGTKPRTLIIAEPPPQVTLPKIKQLLESYVEACEILEWPVMAGGYLNDIVCTIKVDKKPSDWSDTLTKLQLELFGSSESAPIVTLPAPKRRMISHSLDLQYGSMDMYSWIMDTNQHYRRNAISSSINLPDILNNGARGVFTNQDRTLVIWAVDRGGNIDNATGDIRRFAVTSDLILGAIANKNTVIIVARGRIEPLAHLPPLRSETLLLLAGSQEDELHQSYERKHLLAGKNSDGIDRAPILLSQQLVDTEYGNLLNIADQLLKGWSMAGEVKYVDFRYPIPKTYPFGQLPAIEVESDRTEFLFNWNTDGVAYAQSKNGIDIITPQRSGALSIIYGDINNRPRNMENQAYNYFSLSGDSSLARVVQYNLMFQIFRKFNISAKTPTISPRFKEFSSGLEVATRNVFKYLLSDIDEDELIDGIQKHWDRLSKIEHNNFPEGGENWKTFIQENEDLSIAMARYLRKKQLESKGKVAEAMGEIAVLMGRRFELNDQEVEDAKKAVTTLQRYLPEELISELLDSNWELLRQSGMLQVAVDNLGIWKSLASGNNKGTGWDHTAYVVESSGKADAVGGHNLNATMNAFQADASLKPGLINVTPAGNGTWSVAYNPVDSGKLRTIAREIGTHKNLTKIELENEINKVLIKTQAPPPVSLKEIRRLVGQNNSEFKFLPVNESAYQVRELAKSEQEILASLNSVNQDAIILEQLPDGAFVLSRTGSPEALQVSSVTAAIDALANGLIVEAGGKGAVSVLIRGVAAEKTEAMVGLVQSSLRRYPKASVKHVLDSTGDRALMMNRPNLVNERIAHNGINIDKSKVKFETIKSGIYKDFTRVEVPIIIESKAPWHMKIVFFVKNLTGETITSLSNKISAILSSIKAPVSASELHNTIRQQILADLKELNIDSILMQIDSEPTGKIHDVIFAADGRLTNHAA